MTAPLSPPATAAPQETVLRGRVSRIISRDDESGATYAQFSPADGSRSLVVQGVFTEDDLQAREFTVWGTIAVTARGPLFRVHKQWRGVTPGMGAPPVAGVKALCVELLHGIGPKGVEKLAEGLGDQLWTVLTTDPVALGTVVGPEKGLDYHKTLVDFGLPRLTAVAHLLGLGCTFAYATRILEAFGTDAVRIIAENPYKMVGIPGIKFATADRIALQGFAMPNADPRRLSALSSAVLEDAADAGDTSLAWDEAARRMGALGECAAAGIDPDGLITSAVAHGTLATDLGDVYLPRLLNAERRAAEGLARLIARAPRLLAQDPDTDPTLVTFEPEQRTAVRLGLTRGVVLINGRPGTGKTTVAREIVRYAQLAGIPVHLAATTATAADKLTDAITNANVPGASPLLEPVRAGGTIHALAGADASGKTLPRGIVIIDEASMLDLPLLARVVNQCGEHTTLVFLGDPNQLPPVMAGNSSRDLRDSHVVPTIELTKVHRQARNSLIAINAERILLGKMPLFANQSVSKAALRETGRTDLHPDNIVKNTYFRKAPTPLVGAEKIVDTVDRLASKLGMDPVRDVQVFVPTKPGIMGTSNLNRLLQGLVNPRGLPVRPLGTLKFRMDPSPGCTGAGPAADAVPVNETPVQASRRAARIAQWQRDRSQPARRYSPLSGDTIELQKNDGRRGLKAGDRGVVVTQTDGGGVRVLFGGGTSDAVEHVFEAHQFEPLKIVHEVWLRVGDPVLHSKNDGKRDLKNGMRGVVLSATGDGGALVDFGGRHVAYTTRQLNDLLLAYATTVHKAQGHENRVAILGAHHAEHRVLLDKSLLYVGLTRAKEMAFCVGTASALRICLREAHGQARRTRLAERTATIVAAMREADAQATLALAVDAGVATPTVATPSTGVPLSLVRTSAMLSQPPSASAEAVPTPFAAVPLLSPRPTRSRS